MKIYSYDATVPQYPYYRWDTFDPRKQSIKVVYTDWMPKLIIKMIPANGNSDSDAFATIFTPEGFNIGYVHLLQLPI